jgi:hypothetical protein
MSCSQRFAGPPPSTDPEDTIRGLVETLAEFICAADRPHETLRQVTDDLRDEVGALNDLAREHVATLPDNHIG